MKYTKYFAQLFRSHGAAPQLPYDHYRTYLNIIHLEAKLKVYESLNSTHRFTGRIYRINKIIQYLTGGLEPKQLVEKWIAGDRIPKPKEPDYSTPWDDHEPYLTPKPKHMQDDFKSRSRKY